MKKSNIFNKYIIIITLFLLSFLCKQSLHASSLADKLAGRILLQVESKGEAWYVNPVNRMRYFLGLPDDAFRIMREQGVGISNKNLEKIPVNLAVLSGTDTDNDGLPDNFEKAIGTDALSRDSDKDGINDDIELSHNYDPLGNNKLPIDTVFARKQKGKIFLQVESRGEAWYVNPDDNCRYFLGRPIDAFNALRKLGLGINNENLNKIPVIEPAFVAYPLEEKIHTLINEQRIQNGLSVLKWNDKLASVAREHSEDLASENEVFTKMGWNCSFPFIHHEGNDFGLYQDERLKNRGVYYFSSSGENIALNQSATINFSYIVGDSIEAEYIKCDEERLSMDSAFKKTIEELKTKEEKQALLENEITQRINKYRTGKMLNVTQVVWIDNNEIAAKMVDGWMNSPGHKRNILDSEYDETGIGVAQFNGLVIATQVFIKRINCGYQDGPCCEKTGYYPYCYLPSKCEQNICR